MSDVRLVDQIEKWPIERLAPYARNPRTHSDEQVDLIARSIVEFGFTNPVLVDAAGQIVAGHGRVLAARSLGMANVPVVVLGHLSEAQRRAYVIADNKLALAAGWDERLLAEELQALEADEFDLELTGFDEKEIDALYAGIETEMGDTDDAERVPEVPETPFTQLGDLWLLGRHRLLCGDALEAESYSKVLPGTVADMAFTDPPYNVQYQGGAKTGKKPKRTPILNDDLGSAFRSFLEQGCRHVLGHTRGAVYICMASAELDTLKQAFCAAGGHWSTFVIWVKNHFTLGRSDFQRQYEPILYGWREGAKRYWPDVRDQGDVWHFDKPRSNDLHPTMKPVPLVEQAVRLSCPRKGTVLDPFAGSGSTAIACENIDRAAVLIELDPGYCDVIVRRWQEHSGAEAIRESDGAAFTEVADQSK